MFQHPSRIRGGRMNLIKERLFKIAEYEAQHHIPLSEKGKEASADLKALHQMNRKDMVHEMEEFLKIEAKYPLTINVQHQG